jgi:ribosomal protein L35AE/L33A
MKNTSKVFKEKINVSDSKKFLNAKETTVKLKLMDKKMTKQKHISKPLFFMSPYGYYEAPYGKIVDIYNEGGCKSVGEYIENNNISSTEYNG